MPFDIECEPASFAHETDLDDVNSIPATDAYFESIDENLLLEMTGDCVIL